MAGVAACSKIICTHEPAKQAGFLVEKTMKLPNIYAQKIKKADIDLSLSENPLGCSARVLKALRTIKISDVSQYPDTQKLTDTIAWKWNVEPENVLLGCGSEQLIKLIAQTVLLPGDVAVIQNASFAVFLKECMLARASCRLVDIGEIKREIDTQLAFVCNPNNPTGECIPQTFIKQIIQSLPKTIVIVDEANGEFMNDSFIPQAIETKNCIVLRTFSKVIGLAGIRIGFAIGSKGIIARLQQAQQPFPLSSIGCILAKEALFDDAFIQKTKKFIQNERLFLQQELAKRNLKCSDSVTNNLLISSPQAKGIIKSLKKFGVSVVDAKLFPGLTIPGFRISIKDSATNRLFLQNLDKALSCLPKRKLLRSKGGL